MVDGKLRGGCRGELEERRCRAERHAEDHHAPIATEDPRQLEEQSRQRPLPLALGPGGLLGRIAATAAVVGKLPSTPLPLPFGWPAVAWRGAVQRRDAPCGRGAVAKSRSRSIDGVIAAPAKWPASTSGVTRAAAESLWAKAAPGPLAPTIDNAIRRARTMRLPRDVSKR